MTVVTGAASDSVEEICREANVTAIHIPDHATSDMLGSLQLALKSMPQQVEAALVVLGDQPGVKQSVVEALIAQHSATGVSLIVPSYQRRRGHPWLVGRELWPRLLEMHAPETPRDFLDRRAGIIHYVEVDTPSILEDVDTPEDYLNSVS